MALPEMNWRMGLRKKFKTRFLDPAGGNAAAVILLSYTDISTHLFEEDETSTLRYF